MDIDPDKEYPVLRFATYDMLVAHDNEAFLEAQGKIQSQQEEISELKVKLRYLQELYEKLLKLRRSGSSRGAGQSGTCEKAAFLAYPPLQNNGTKLPQLDHTEYPQVKFWTRDHWDKHCALNKGRTDGLAQTAGKRGRPAKRTSEESEETQDELTKHPYIETIDGRPVSGLHLHRIGVKARSIWASLANRGLAPEKFKKMDSAAKNYYFTEMANEFFELRLCSDSWKLEFWSTRNYASWSQNHLEEKKESSKRRKLEKEAWAAQTTQISLPPQPPMSPQQEPSQPLAPPSGPSQPQPQPQLQPQPQPQLQPQPPRPTTPNTTMRLIFENNCDNANFFNELDQQAAASSNAIQNQLRMQENEGDDGTASNGQAAAGTGKEKPRALAVVGTGPTTKNLCMTDWLKTHPGGYKDDFEEYFKGLTQEELQPFVAAAKDAVNARARERRNANKSKNPKK